MVTVCANDGESLDEDATCEVITTTLQLLILLPFLLSFIHVPFMIQNDSREETFE